jgi:hypothetical protein
MLCNSAACFSFLTPASVSVLACCCDCCFWLQHVKLQQDNDMLQKQVDGLTLEKADMLRQIQVRGDGRQLPTPCDLWPVIWCLFDKRSHPSFRRSRAGGRQRCVYFGWLVGVCKALIMQEGVKEWAV